jgi:hypothetical protein
MAINIGPALKVRIKAGRIQEMHTDAAMNDREMALKIEFVPNAPAALAEKTAKN